MNLVRCASILSLLSIVARAESPTTECERFAFDPTTIDVGTVYHYTKSNIDGSQAIDVTVYVASESDLEVLKIEADGSGGAYVTANMNWRTFSPSSLLSWFFLTNGQLSFQARLGVDADRHVFAEAVVHVAVVRELLDRRARHGVRAFGECAPGVIAQGDEADGCQHNDRTA